MFPVAIPAAPGRGGSCCLLETSPGLSLRAKGLLLLLWDGTGDVQSWRKGRASSRVASEGLVRPLGHGGRAA